MCTVNYKKIRYVVSVNNKKKIFDNGTTYPRCKFPRERPVVRIRGCSEIYNCSDSDSEDIIKTINYPEELWDTEVLENDKIETDLIIIRDNWPEWYVIDVLYNK